MDDRLPETIPGEPFGCLVRDLHARRERADFLDGRRVGEAHLEDGSFGKDILHVLVGHAGSDEAKLANVNASIDELRAVVGGGTVESTTSTEE